MPLAAGILALGLLSLSAATPLEFVHQFMEGLRSDKAASLEGLFLPDPDLRAQAKSIHTLVHARKLDEKRIYSVPDGEPLYALVRLKTRMDDDGIVFVLGLRLEKRNDRWLVTAPVTLTRVGLGKVSGPDSVRNEIRILMAMLEGVEDFVDEMMLIYGPYKKR